MTDNVAVGTALPPPRKWRPRVFRRQWPNLLEMALAVAVPLLLTTGTSSGPSFQVSTPAARRASRFSPAPAVHRQPQLRVEAPALNALSRETTLEMRSILVTGARRVGSALRIASAKHPRGASDVMEADPVESTLRDPEDAPAVNPVQAMPGVGEYKVAIITGASTGIGLATATGMAQSGRYRKIIFAGRDPPKHESAMAEVKLAVSGTAANATELEYSELDLSSLSSVRSFAKSFLASGQALDTLVLNAGVMALPQRQVTKDGHEYQMGVNHLGHFLLANLLMDVLVRSGSAADPSRVISLSSSAHQIPSPLLGGDLGNLQSQNYSPWVAYGQSKLANILFAYELDRRCRQRGLPVAANAVHPGGVDTELGRHLAGSAGDIGKQLESLARPVMSTVIKSAADGARTSVLLATGPEGKLSGRYWLDERPAASMDVDPTGELPGPLKAFLPDAVKPKLTSYDPQVWKSLWQVSEELTGMKPGEVACLADS